jgi:hypothetical protein
MTLAFITKSKYQRGINRLAALDLFACGLLVRAKNKDNDYTGGRDDPLVRVMARL